MTKRERQAKEYYEESLPLIGGPLDGERCNSFSDMLMFNYLGRVHYYHQEHARYLYVGAAALPDVGPAWWDDESEGVYSEDPEDGYPYDE